MGCHGDWAASMTPRLSPLYLLCCRSDDPGMHQRRRSSSSTDFCVYLCCCLIILLHIVLLAPRGGFSALFIQIYVDPSRLCKRVIAMKASAVLVSPDIEPDYMDVLSFMTHAAKVETRRGSNCKQPALRPGVTQLCSVYHQLAVNGALSPSFTHWADLFRFTSDFRCCDTKTIRLKLSWHSDGTKTAKYGKITATLPFFPHFSHLTSDPLRRRPPFIRVLKLLTLNLP